MKVTIEHFRCYIDTFTCEFEPLKFTLLSGESGKGKSTIFNAILWCLYGGMQKIKPHKSDNKSTMVKLEIPEMNNIVIKRSTPNNIEIILNNGIILNGDGAQGYIDNYLGHKNLWISSSYITQGSRNPLLIASNSEKFQLLQELTYGCNTEIEENTPEYYLEKCDIYLNEIKSKITLETSKYNNMRDNYTQNYTSNENIIKLWPTNTDISNLKNFIEEKNKCKNLLLDYKKNLIISRDIESKRDIILNLLAQIDQQLQEIPLIPDLVLLKNELEELEIKYHKLVEIHRRYLTIQELKNKRDSLGYIPKDYSSKLILLQKKLSDFEAYTKSCLLINTTPNKIEDEIIFLKNEYILYTEESIEYDKKLKELALLEAENDIKRNELEYQWKIECDITKDNYNKSIQEIKDIKTKNDLMSYQYQVEFDKHAALVNKNKTDIINYNKIKDLHNIQKNRLETISVNFNITSNEYNNNIIIWKGLNPLLEFNEININNKIHDSKMLLEELICPHCFKGVIYENKNLHRGNSTNETKEKALKEINIYQNMLNNIKIYNKEKIDFINEQNYYDNLGLLPENPSNIIIEEISDPPILIPIPALPVLTLPVKPVLDFNISSFMIKKPRINPIDRLNQLQALGLPPNLDINTIKKEIIDLEKGFEYDKINLQLEAIGVVENLESLENITKIIATNKNNINIHQNNENQKNMLLLKKQDLCKDLPEKPLYSSKDLLEGIKIIENNIDIYTNYISAGNIILNLEEERKKLDYLHLSILEISKEENLLNSLKHLINEVSTSSLEETLNAINVTTNLILKEIFDENIVVIASTHKELKTKDKTKLQINLQIYYKDTIYDGPSMLSGGEFDRLSLALTLAISRVSGSTLLLLDECISSINDDLRERCIEAIRLYLPNKTILHIAHESVEGRHDRSIKI